MELTENTVCIHHFNASWHDKFDKYIHEKRSLFIKKYGDKAEEKYKKFILKGMVIYVK